MWEGSSAGINNNNNNNNKWSRPHSLDGAMALVPSIYTYTHVWHVAVFCFALIMPPLTHPPVYRGLDMAGRIFSASASSFQSMWKPVATSSQGKSQIVIRVCFNPLQQAMRHRLRWADVFHAMWQVLFLHIK